MNDALNLGYSDNEKVTVGDRLRAEIEDGERTLDVASGYLSPSVWVTVGGAFSSLEHFRLLLGKDYELDRVSRAQVEADIADLVAQALRDETEPPRLPERRDAEAIRGFIEFLERDGVEVKAWRGEGFLHAKAYIFEASAGVGSANLTWKGLNQNRELVMWRQDRPVVADLRDWFNRYWEAPESVDYREELIRLLRETRFGGAEYLPFDVFIRTLAARYGCDEPPELKEARFELKWFQTDAVFRLIKLLSSRSRGALLADAVGLGKTYMALGCIHYFLHQERETVLGKPVTLIIPASLRHDWETVLDKACLLWAVNMIHTQELRRDFEVSPHVGSELVVIDEAHRLRGGRVWFRKVNELLQASVDAGGDPRVLLLTATPVNTGIKDLVNLVRVLTKNRRNVWAPDIPDFERYLKAVEQGRRDPYPLLDRCVVRRSRSDIIDDWEQRRAANEHLEVLRLPKRRLGHEEYSYTSSRESDLFDVFANTVHRLVLAPYDLERFRRPANGQQVDPDLVPSSELKGLYVTGLLKRFESSVRAVRISLERLARLLSYFQEAVTTSPPRLISVERSRALRDLVQQEIDEDDDDIRDVEASELDRILDDLPIWQDADQYDIAAVVSSLVEDHTRVSDLLERLPSEDDDGKIDALIELLTRTTRGARLGLADKRVLIFSQYRDTARYVHERLTEAGKRSPSIRRVELVDGSTPGRRRDEIAKTFDPAATDEYLKTRASAEELPRVLVSTDVLAEGHNLQLADAVVNFDLHWNPQVAVQRSGRVDRLNSPHDIVYLVSFLPEEGLDTHLDLVQRLNERFSLYKHLGLADEPVTKLASDQVEALSLEQLRRFYLDDESVLDEIERTWTLGSTDYMRAPLLAYLREVGDEAVQQIPLGVQSIKRIRADWPHGPGAFIALRHGRGEDAETFWRFYPRVDHGWGDPMTDDVELFNAIRSSRSEARAPLPTEQELAGPGGVVDWDLLRRCAEDIARDLTERRATHALLKGASEQSQRVREQVIEASEGTGLDTELHPLLDRLEEVRVEDYDHLPGYRTWREHLRLARRSEVPTERRELLVDVIELGIELFGVPDEGMDISREDSVVQPEDLELVAWEALVVADTSSPEENGSEQLAIES